MRVPVLNPAPLVAVAQPRVQVDAKAADAFGAGLGQGIESAAKTAFGIWRQEANRVNDARVMEADTSDAGHDLQTWTALQQARGKDAPAAFNTAVDERQKYQAKVEAGLSNPVQREAFRRAAAGRLQSFENRGAAHVLGETQRYEGEVADASLETGLQQVSASRNDWHAAAGIMEQTITTRQQFLAKRGTSPEEIAKQTALIRSTATRRVIDGLVSDQNDLAAKRLADQYGGYLTAEDRIAVNAKLKVSTTKGEGQRQSAAIWSPTKSLEDMLAEADKIDDQGVQEEARNRIVNLYSTHKKTVEDSQSDAMTTSWEKMNESPNGIGEVTTDDIIAMGPSRYASLQAAEKRRLAPTTDPRLSSSLLYNLRNLAATNPAAFLRTDLTKPDAEGNSPLTILNKSDFDEIAKLQTDGKEKGDTSKLMQEAGERQRIIAETLAPLGIEATISPKNSSLDKVLSFHRQFDAAMAQEKGDSGRPVSTETARKIAAGLGQTITTETHWYGDTKVPLFLAIDAIPAADREQIVTAYKKAHAGAIPGPADIALRWRLKQEAGQ